MTKEEILDNHIKQLLSDNPAVYQPFDEIKASKEYQMQLQVMEQYANQRALEVAGDAWDACYRWGAHRYSKRKTAPPPDRKTFLSNLKKKLDDKAQ